MTIGSARRGSEGRVRRAAEMPRCGTRDVQFARLFEDEKELPVPRCSAAQAHLTVASAASERSEAKSAARRVSRRRAVRQGVSGGDVRTSR